ncbi:MAG: phage holin family protein [Desulfotomaculaceae bacterium]|nr:phage holin family protein [Desulfotomaculaceae bacterium]
MTGWLIRWVLNIIAIIFTAYLISGFEVTVPGAIFGSIILGVINAIIRPVVLLLTLPINIITLGLFTLVVNGLMLWLTSSVIKGFEVQGFGTAIIAALVLTLFSFVISFFVKD